MADEPNEFNELHAELFGGDSDAEKAEKRHRNLARRVERLDNHVRNLRLDLKREQSRARSLKLAAQSFIGPAVLGGIFAFSYAWERSEGLFEIGTLLACAAFGLFWVFEVCKEFDSI